MWGRAAVGVPVPQPPCEGQGIWGTGSHLPPNGCEARTQAFKLGSKLLFLLNRPTWIDCFLRCHFALFPCKHLGKQSWVWFSRLLFCFSCCRILVIWAESSLDQGLSSVNGKGGFIFSLSQYLFIYLFRCIYFGEVWLSEANLELVLSFLT